MIFIIFLVLNTSFLKFKYEMILSKYLYYRGKGERRLDGLRTFNTQLLDSRLSDFLPD